MQSYMKTIFPVIGKIPTLFKVKSKNELREAIGEKLSFEKTEFPLTEAERIDEADKIDNLIPGIREIPLQKLFDAGFTIKAYLKEDSKNCVDDLNESGVLIINIQHSNPDEAYLVDGFSLQFDPVTEIEISTINALILNNEKPGIFGPKYDINESAKVGSIKIRDILLEREEAKKLRDEALKKYSENPELRNKDTKKIIENLRFKFNQIKDKASADKSAEFTQGALKLLSTIAGINNLESFDQIKNVPLFKEELDKGGSFSDLLQRFCTLAEALPQAKK